MLQTVQCAYMHICVYMCQLLCIVVCWDRQVSVLHRFGTGPTLGSWNVSVYVVHSGAESPLCPL